MDGFERGTYVYDWYRLTGPRRDAGFGERCKSETVQQKMVHNII